VRVLALVQLRDAGGVEELEVLRHVAKEAGQQVEWLLLTSRVVLLESCDKLQFTNTN
jgi:hypothetical protein